MSWVSPDDKYSSFKLELLRNPDWKSKMRNGAMFCRKRDP
jgi:hypothetical protein